MRADTYVRRRRGHAVPLPTRQSILEWITLLLVAFPALVGTWLFGSVRLWSVGPQVLMICVSALLLVARRFLYPHASPLHVPPGALVLLVFVGYAFVRSFSATVPHDARVVVFTLASYLMAYVVWTTLASHQKRWRWLVGAMMLSVTVMAWYALVQHGQESRGVLNLIRPEQYGMRASGAYFCPNHFANLVAVFVPFGLSLALCRAAGGALRILSLYTVLLMLPPLFLTQSRSGWLGMMAGVVMLVLLLSWRAGGRKFLLALLVVPVVLAVIGGSAWFLSDIVRTRVEHTLQGDVRLSIWRDTWALIQDSPVFGFGPASYLWMYPHYRNTFTAYMDPQFAHNEYLQLLAEYGIVGLVLMGSVFAVAAWSFLRTLRDPERHRDVHLVAGLVGATVTSLVHACFDYNFHLFSNVHVLIAFAGITAACLHASGEWTSQRLEGVRGVVASIGGALAVLVVLAGMSQALAAYSLNLVADQKRADLKIVEAERLYRRAAAIDPEWWAPKLALADMTRIRSFWNLDREERKNLSRQAIDLYEEVLKRNPWHPDAMFGIYKSHLALGDGEKALSLLKELVEKVPHQAFYLNELGIRLRLAGRDAEALAYFEKSMRVSPSEMAQSHIRDIQAKLSAPPQTSP